LSYPVRPREQPRCSSSEKSLQYLGLFHFDAREQSVNLRNKACYVNFVPPAGDNTTSNSG